MTYQPGVDAVVVNYKTSSDLDDFLRSWHENLPEIPWDLWIVNIEATDEDRAVAQAWAGKLGPHAHLVEYAWNCGYSHSVNQALVVGTRETVVAFNADVILSAGAVDECCRELHAHGEWAVLGPRQVDQQGRITHAGIFGTLDKPQHRGWREHDNGQYSDVLENAITVSGSAYFVKRADWAMLTNCPKYRAFVPATSGAFLPTLFGWEETWVSVHAISHGRRVCYYGPVSLVHKFHQAVKVNGMEHWTHQAMKDAHGLYRAACESHGIPHD